MICQTYIGKKDPNLSVLVPAEQGTAAVPDAVEEKLGGLVPSGTLDLENPPDYVYGLLPDEALSNVRKRGYHLEPHRIAFCDQDSPS